MSNLVFTLYEADEDHLAIAWGPMPLEDAIVEATNLVAESSASVFGATTEDERYEGIRQDWFAFENGMDPQDKDEEDDSRRMGWLCEWLTHRRNQAFANAWRWESADGKPFTMDNPAFTYFYTEEVEA